MILSKNQTCQVSSLLQIMYKCFFIKHKRHMVKVNTIGKYILSVDAQI